MNELEHLKEKILKEYPRLGLEDRFCFECGPDLECFNVCCADVNIFLTPYDVLRMRKALNIDSATFLSRYTIIPIEKSQKLPVPLMKMRDTERKECHFVDEEKGCTIYDDRPWPCRIYPIGSASPSEAEVHEEKFYFIIKEEHCKGHNRPREWTVAEWLKDQETETYAKFGELFKNITIHPSLERGKKLSPQQIDMYWAALYDLDKFRRFIFESSFLKRFNVDEEELRKIKSDDVELLRFGFKWIGFALFGEKRIEMKPDADKWSKVRDTKPKTDDA